ncbi:MAG: V4R domain-containing protein [Thermoproteota archaeon]
MEEKPAKNLSGEKIEKLNPKEVLCAEQHPDAELIEISVKMRKTPGVFTNVVKTLYERRVKLFSGFHTVSREGDTVLIGAFIDISNSDAQAKDIVKDLESIEGVLEVNFSEKGFNGLMIDNLHFPLLVSGERSFTFRVETFGRIVESLYEKFGTGAAVVLYQMGVSAGEDKVRNVLNKHRMSKLDVLKLILAERTAKGWCMAEVVEFNSEGATLIVRELFECLPFKGKKGEAFSQFFRGYLAGVFEHVLNTSVSVVEAECIAKGDPTCKFIIQARR